MSDFYIPGIWAQRYEHLPPPEKADVNEETDRRFRARTGVARALDPKKDPGLAVRWLRIRDEVVAQLAGKGSSDPRKTSRGLAVGLPSPMKNFAYLLLYNYDIGEHRPKPEHIQALNRAVVPLLKLKGMDFHFGVIGNASRTGSDGDNQALSDRRAAEVDKYLRKMAAPAVKFFKPAGAGEKDQVSTAPQYRDAWPKLESIDEDERDRSVVVLVQWQPVGAADDYFDALAQSKIDWDRAFHLAAQRAALMYLVGGFIAITGDYGPSPKVKGVPSPWNPVTGWPASWTMADPDGEAVMKAMMPQMLREIEQAARNMKLNITRAEIEARYAEWLKSPTNKWVK